MSHLKSNFVKIRLVVMALVLFAMISGSAASGFCAAVALETARGVAEAKMLRHVALYGHWNGVSVPEIIDCQVVRDQGAKVAFDFKVRPGGHILVAADDDLVPVPLYSTRSGFNPGHADDSNAIESWIVPELGGKLGALKENRRRSAGISTQNEFPGRNRIKAAWAYFEGQSGAGDAGAAPSRSGTSAAVTVQGVERGAISGPLVTTQWSQQYPFNSKTPENNCYNPVDAPTNNTLSGCVATAWAQVLRYYQWPDAGVGNHSYPWNGQTVSVDFTDVRAYDWANMPDVAAEIDTPAERDAVGRLMLNAGVVAETDFGCAVSDSDIWANDVLDAYFKYKSMEIYHKGDPLPDDRSWFQMFKVELDAARIVIFSIYSQRGGHEVVADGYQDDTTEMIHINFGWSGNSDAFYDITDAADFTTTSDQWSTSEQYIVVGIEPNYNTELPAVTIAAGDQTVDEHSQVQMTGSASHSSLAIAAYEWLNVAVAGSGKVAISNGSTREASFTAPYVDADTDFVFMLKAVDAQRGVGYAKCTISVRDTGISATPVPQGSGGSSGGCFVMAAIH
jgi:hypothetical protein